MSGDPQGGLGRVGRTSGRLGMGLGTHEKFWDGPGDPRGSLGPVKGT